MGSPLDYNSISSSFQEQNYLVGEPLAKALYLALELEKPLLLEGEPGVGKTQVAQVLAQVLGRNCIRLQCYEGIDADQALYEWNHAKQLLELRRIDAEQAASVNLYDDDFLIERPLLKALNASNTSILLIDEIDRADDAFEAFLLEFLSEFQISIPELGSRKAASPIITILTSNRTRELHDALKRRCLYHWIDYPSRQRELEIIKLYEPGLSGEAAQSLIDAVQAVRGLSLQKKPGISESIDWSRASMSLMKTGSTWPDALKNSLGLLLKNQDDLLQVQAAGVL